MQYIHNQALMSRIYKEHLHGQLDQKGPSNRKIDNLIWNKGTSEEDIKVAKTKKAHSTALVTRKCQSNLHEKL